MDWLLRYVPLWRPLCVQHSVDHSTVQCAVTTFWISDFLANVAWDLKCWDSQDTSNDLEKDKRQIIWIWVYP